MLPPAGRSYCVTFVCGFQKYLRPDAGSNKASHGCGSVGSCCLWTCGAQGTRSVLAPCTRARNQHCAHSRER